MEAGSASNGCRSPDKAVLRPFGNITVPWLMEVSGRLIGGHKVCRNFAFILFLVGGGGDVVYQAASVGVQAGRCPGLPVARQALCLPGA